MFVSYAFKGVLSPISSSRILFLRNIIYSYTYLESDLIKHCHVIFIHSLGQPLIVRSHSKVHRSQGNPHVSLTCFQLQLLSLIQQTTNMASSDRFVAVDEEEILYIILNIFAKPQVFYYLVSNAKIFDIIYQLSPLLECDPTVCLPSKSQVTLGQARG